MDSLAAFVSVQTNDSESQNEGEGGDVWCTQGFGTLLSSTCLKSASL